MFTIDYYCTLCGDNGMESTDRTVEIDSTKSLNVFVCQNCLCENYIDVAHLKPFITRPGTPN